MADWKDVARVVAPYAPTVGQFLGGFIPIPGGSIVGEWAGNMLAQKLGVPPTPEAVAHQISVLPPQELQTKLAEAEQEAQAKYETLRKLVEVEAQVHTEGVKQINETIRAEVTAKIAWWHWRHLLGYVIGLWYVVPLFGLARVMYAPDPAVVVNFTNLLANASAYVLAGSALLGAVAWDTSRYKEALTTGAQRGGIVAAVASKVAGKR